MEEWRDLAEEWRQGCSWPSAASASRWCERQRGRWRHEVRPSLDLNAFCERTHERWRGANRRFDDWFNAGWFKLVADLRQHWKEVQERKAGSPGPAADTTAMVLLGAGVGSALHGLTGAGTVLSAWGVCRACRRYVVQKVDDGDVEALFRWAPERIRRRRGELFGRMRAEVDSFRRLRMGDLRFIHKEWANTDEKRRAMDDPTLDHTPESLFETASVAGHPRVRDAIGPGVRVESEPDKVVYRIHEGIAEVYLGWHVLGSSGKAEVQVKATGSIVDFIYVFPLVTNRYGIKDPGFVIRPKGTWSMDTKDLPRDAKQPFGAEGDSGRLKMNRQGIFEYDWEVRDFRHGKENLRRGFWS
ncbi:unnamed protein product [Prorocentrum cordatum]|uniref:Uncharacterized protein n=1 Tax=Prorocentrum cordatum TaxID=2364126 RepID=A0ABN9TFI8_9DINO|nr:unnamed protein product [Polarella glacialis]